MSTNNVPLNYVAVSSSSPKQTTPSLDTVEHEPSEEYSDEDLDTEEDAGSEWESGVNFSKLSDDTHATMDGHAERGETYQSDRGRSISGDLTEGEMSVGSGGDERSRSGSIGASITPKRRRQNRDSSRRFRERQMATIASMEERLAEMVASKNDLKHQILVLEKERLQWVEEEVAMKRRLVCLASSQRQRLSYTVILHSSPYD
jgi:hypothetical protein